MPETPVFPAAAVAAPHALAAETGRAVLAEGGNAVEAMVAMAATIAVVYPHMNAIGGDGFWLVREPGGRVRGIEACGPAGSLATRERYRAKGYDAIPPRGPDAALTVAGRWPAGASPSTSPRRSAAACPSQPFSPTPSASPARAPPSRAPRPATSRRRPRRCAPRPAFPKPSSSTARSPRPARSAGCEARRHPRPSRRGRPRRLLPRRRRPRDRRRSRAHRQPRHPPRPRSVRATPREPLSARLQNFTAYNFPPPTQGLASLLILGIAERLKQAGPEDPDTHHGLIEAAKRAAAIRDRVVTDPAHLRHDPQSFLTPAVFEREAAAIRADRAGDYPLPAPAEGDTIWMGAIDRDGLSVSFIQSIYWEYGSGCVLRETGILWQNRGVAFSLDPASPNPLQPGRKPFHTLNPALAVLATGACSPTGPWAARGSRSSRRRFSLATFGAKASPTRWTPRAGCSAAPGARRAPA
jgi:gamma-glutamyltranspeptidase/glutathione hydrolase